MHHIRHRGAILYMFCFPCCSVSAAPDSYLNQIKQSRLTWRPQCRSQIKTYHFPWWHDQLQSIFLSWNRSACHWLGLHCVWTWKRVLCMHLCTCLCFCVFAFSCCHLHFCTALCVHTLAAVLSLFYPRLFSNLVHFNMHFLLCPTSWNVFAAAWTPRSASSLLYAFALVNLLLTETSATIKVSPVGGVMVLKGFACILETGLGNILGCHVCRFGMTQNSWECQKPPPPPPFLLL